jgi:parvulin-like peptidyl-prolyl isomerase
MKKLRGNGPVFLRRLLIIGWFTALSGCDTPPNEQELVAQVGDAALSLSQLEDRLSPGDDPTNEAANAMVEGWVKEELLFQEAKGRNLDQAPHIRALLEQARRDILVAELLNSEFEDKELEITEDAVLGYFDAHRAEFVLTQPRVRARHVLLASQRDARTVRQALVKGDSFETVAEQYSQDQETKLVGGDLGYFSEFNDPILWEACLDLPLNTFSKARQTQYGYHIIQVLERQEAGTLRELDGQVRDQIVENLVRLEHRRRLDELVTRLKGQGEWTIFER